MPAGATYPVHSHPWGEFVFSFSGVMEVRLEGDHLTAPANYGNWLPPGVVHEGLNRYSATHCSLYLMPELCLGMPEVPCTLQVNPLTIALLEHLRLHPLLSPLSEENHRLLDVLRDQLKSAQRYKNFCPTLMIHCSRGFWKNSKKIWRMIRRWQNWLLHQGRQ